LDIPLLSGFAASAVFGLLAIALLVSYVRTRSYQPFVWYRLGFAAMIMIVYLLRP
jgi:undecaprenyl pyrophosphate phosphatase UppP